MNGKVISDFIHPTGCMAKQAFGHDDMVAAINESFHVNRPSLEAIIGGHGDMMELGPLQGSIMLDLSEDVAEMFVNIPPLGDYIAKVGSAMFAMGMMYMLEQQQTLTSEELFNLVQGNLQKGEGK